ncbi:MAG: thioredoxin domain-containing protein [Bifidobacteriaceae bacterium]|jgi:protein-disulfide isomerase|nr:thioredoxin domain-containing protein [Bifidobacteriaceae bacterium]
MTEPASGRPSGSLGTWIGVVAAVATVALGVSITALVVGLNRADDAGAPDAGIVGTQGNVNTGEDAGGEAAADLPAAGGEAPEVPVEPAATGDPRTVPGVAVGAGGAALTGIPSEPRVRVDTFFDFMCPYCAQFEENYAAELQRLVDEGEIVWVQHPMAFLDRFSMETNYSSRTAHAANVVAQQTPEAFGAFVTALFAVQPAENTAGLTDAQIVQIAQDAGAPESVTSSFWQQDYLTELAVAAEAAINAGVTGTPTALISTPDSAPEKWDFTTPIDQVVAQKAGQ